MPREAAFVAAYVRTRSATAAAFEAGFAVSSASAAGVAGHRMLQRPHVRALLAKAQRTWEREYMDGVAAAAREVARRLIDGPPR